MCRHHGGHTVVQRAMPYPFLNKSEICSICVYFMSLFLRNTGRMTSCLKVGTTLRPKFSKFSFSLTVQSVLPQLLGNIQRENILHYAQNQFLFKQVPTIGKYAENVREETDLPTGNTGGPKVLGSLTLKVPRTGTLLKQDNYTAKWDGMGDVGSARYKPALLPPCPTIRVLSYSNYQRSSHSISK